MFNLKNNMNDDIKESVIKKLNKELGADPKNLEKCELLCKKLQEEKNEVEKMLSLASSEVPSKVAAAVNSVEEIGHLIEDVTKDYETLESTTRNQFEHVESATDKLQEYVDKIQDLERLLAYFKCTRSIQDLSTRLESSLSERDDARVVSEFQQLCQMCTRLHTTQCSHLATFLKETLHYWHNVLKNKFSLQFEETLKSVKWPLVSANNLLASPSQEMLPKFQLLVKYLLNIQLPTEMTPAPAVTSSLLVDFPTATLPMVLLLRPLRKRFLFHFTGTKQTNRADKPEWFFTQILTWIRDHEKFIVQWVQPVYNQCGLHSVSAKLELMRGLVQLAVEKLHNDLPQLQFDDALFSHTVDETLGFDRELRDSFDYPPSEPSAVTVLTQAQVFVKWIHMERKYARDKMDAMLSSETAWLPLVGGEGDDLKITEVGEAFLTLLSTITDRYSMLPQPGHRLQFLELQLELIDDFRVRLFQLLHTERQDPLDSLLPAILNTASYLATALTDWGTSIHFLMLQHYKSQLETTGNEDITSMKLAAMKQGSVFDEALQLLHHLIDELLDVVCEAVMLEVKARSRAYRHDKWFAMSVNSVLPTVTPNACPMFQVLMTKLHQLQTILSTPLFNSAWESIANQLSDFLLEEVILENKFNDGGAQQLEIDVNRNLIPLFHQYTNRPELYFHQVKEACSLLSIKPLQSAWLQGKLDSLPIEVTHLKPQQVIDVLHRRIDVMPDLM